MIPEAGDYVDVREITDLLDKTRRIGPKKLGMAFRGNLHEISQGDYDQIERLLRERARQLTAMRPPSAAGYHGSMSWTAPRALAGRERSRPRFLPCERCAA